MLRSLRRLPLLRARKPEFPQSLDVFVLRLAPDEIVQKVRHVPSCVGVARFPVARCVASEC